MKVKRLDSKAIIPTKSHASDAGWDLYAAEDVEIIAGYVARVNTKIALAIPNGWFGLICDRSSMGLKGIKVHGGVIDSSYRGEIIVCLNYVVQHEHEIHEEYDYYGGVDYRIKTQLAIYNIKAGDKIAQLVLLPVPPVLIEEVKTLDETERGDGGFGSTGR